MPGSASVTAVESVRQEEWTAKIQMAKRGQPVNVTTAMSQILLVIRHWTLAALCLPVACLLLTTPAYAQRYGVP